MNINKPIFEQKISSLKAFNIFDNNLIDKFSDIISKSSDWDLIRINPVNFADRNNIGWKDALDLFIYGAKIGLFDFEWNLLCPACAGVVSSYNNIGEVSKETYYCELCDLELTLDLSEYVEVAFTLDPGVAVLNVDPYKNREEYFKYHFSDNFESIPELEEYIVKHEVGFKIVSPNEDNKFTFTAKPNTTYKIKSADAHSKFTISVTDKTSDVPQIIDVDLLPAGFSVNELSLPAGKITLNIKNHLYRKSAFMAFIHNDSIYEFMKGKERAMKPFITGKKLLNNQSFRDLFRIQSLPNDLQLKVSNITILFTDLKGSTELYEKTGDMTAYNLVQKHFELLKKTAKKYSGAIIKTIGDAIMASFSNPIDGLRASIDMMRDMENLNKSLSSTEDKLSIKVGLHTGSALAVTANESLDYFGQTVNIAARVQGLAEGGEIWVTEPVYDFIDTQDALKSSGYKIEKQSAILKGVSNAVTVYKCVV